MIKINSISKSYGGNTVLDDVSFNIADGHKVAIVGSNGVGKSILLKIIASKIKPDSGTINIDEGSSIGYLPQEVKISDTYDTIEDYLKKCVGIYDTEKKMSDLEKNLNNPENLSLYGKLQDKYMSLRGYEFEDLALKIKSGLGLKDISLDKQISLLSGGEKVKIGLLSILLKGHDIIILDEPTNSLDFKAIKWLENYLANIAATCVIVSHDRYFLDKIVNEIIEIDWFTKKILKFHGTYSNYIEYKKNQYDKKMILYRQQQEKINKLQKAIKDKKTWGEKASKQTTSDNDKLIQGRRRDRSTKSDRSAKALEKRIELIGKIEKPKSKERLSIGIDSSKRIPNSNIDLKKLIIGYDDFKVGPIDLYIPYSERIVIIGNNGSGKTTLLDSIFFQKHIISGQVKNGKQINIGYLKQDNTLKKDQTVGEYLLKEKEMDIQFYFHTLIKFGFDIEVFNQKFDALSPGERSRVILASFLLRNVNTLLLDEPTNHLDIDALNALEDMIDEFCGTILLVSHDRYFIERTKPERIYQLDRKLTPIDIDHL